MNKHPMVRSLLSLKGNPRACVLTEPLWSIPHTLFVPFASVYMLALGLSDVQIGLVVSLNLFVRAAAAMISGAVTDKLGRKRATLIFDLFAWSVPCLLWALSQNVWWFCAAAMCNGFWQLTDNSWTCLLVEDADKSKIVDVYSWVYVSGQLAVFFAPLSGLMVSALGVVTAVRILYGFSFVSMTAKFIILNRWCEETQVGKERLVKTRGLSLFAILAEYKDLIPRFFRSGAMRLAMAVSILFIAANQVMDSFFGIYATQSLLMPEAYLAYLPIIRSAILLTFLFFVQPRIARFGFKAPMLVGVALYIVSHVALIGLPAALGGQGGIMIPAVYTVIQTCAHGLVMPRKDSLVALSLDPEERARLTSVLTVAVLCVTIPFGYLAGLLSDAGRSLPFVLNLALYAAAFLLLFFTRRLPQGRAAQEQA